MTAWDITPGRWEIAQGVDADNDDALDGEALTQLVDLERTGNVSLTFQPHVATILNLKLITKGTACWTRPDLGIGKDDVVVQGRKISVTVHSLGALDTQPTQLALLDNTGKMIATVPVSMLKAPADLLPKKITLTLTVPAGAQIKGGSVLIDPNTTMKEFTRLNNRVQL